jgi:CHAD domain-containing protein
MVLSLIKSAPVAFSSRDPRAKLLLDLGNELQQALRQCRDRVAESTVHDVRVAARRLRSVLRSLRDEINPHIYESLRFELKQIGRTLAPARTAATRLRQIARLFDEKSRRSTSDGSQLTELFVRMVERRHRELATVLQSDRWRDRTQRVSELLRDNNLLLFPVAAARDLNLQIQKSSLQNTLQSLRKRRQSARKLHRQRIAIKNTRYVLEAITPATAIDARGAIEALHQAQDELGEVNDWSGLAKWLNTAAITTPLQRDIARRAEKLRVKHTRRFEKMRPALRRSLRKLSKVC